MTQIIPALMPRNFDEFASLAEQAKRVADFVQLDVMDGNFVPSKSWPHSARGQEDFKALVEESLELPLWKDLNYEVDLMVAHPERIVDDWITVGVKRIVMHIESTNDIKNAIEIIRDRTGASDSEWGVEIGLSLNTTTDIKELDIYMNDIDFVQCMGIARIGYQGEGFDERGLMQVEVLRKKYPDLIISVDGSVNNETARKFADAGANRLVVGSALFAHPDIMEAMEGLKETLDEE